MTLALRDARLPFPALGICLAPWTDLTNSGASMTANAADPLISPLYADLTGLSPIYIQAGSAEILHGIIGALADCAKQQGAPGVYSKTVGQAPSGWKHPRFTAGCSHAERARAFEKSPTVLRYIRAPVTLEV